jgi:hypothetical protein
VPGLNGRLDDPVRRPIQNGTCTARAQRVTTTQSPQLRVALHADEMLVGRLGSRVEIDADARRAADRVLAELQASAASEPLLVSAEIKPLRVADASVMPQIITGPGTNASVHMIAGRASELILGRTAQQPPPAREGTR